MAVRRDLEEDELGSLGLFMPRASQALSSLVGKESDFWGGEWKLLWASDLDRDGKPDVYAEVSDDYDRSQRKLFFSCQARKGRLVREVAEFATTGC
jgi:hypothetical protein